MSGISIITAVWNPLRNGREESLRKCIASVAALRCEYEHIIIDGASNDGTVDLLRSLQKDYPRLRLISEPDRGIYDALNKGIRVAHWNWINILGCDDYIWDAEVLSNIVYESHDDVDLIITPVKREDDLRTINMKSCMYSIPYCHQGLLTSKRAFEKVGLFDINYKLLADFKFTLNAHLLNLKYKIVNKKFAYYSLGGASSNWEKSRVEGAMIMAEVYGLCDFEKDNLISKHVLPIRICIRHLLHTSAAIRKSALWSLCKTIGGMI